MATKACGPAEMPTMPTKTAKPKSRRKLEAPWGTAAKLGWTLRSQPNKSAESRQPPPLPIEIGMPQILNWIMPSSRPMSMPMPKKMKSVTAAAVIL